MKKLLPVFLSLIIFSLPSIAQSLIWQKSLGGSGDDEANCIKVTSDGSFIIVGEAHSSDGDLAGSGFHGNYDIWMVKLNSDGSFAWKRVYGGVGDDIGSSVVPTSDGGYVVAGYSNLNSSDVSGNHGGNDFWVFKTNATGTITPSEWKNSFGGTLDDKAFDVLQTLDGGYIVAGETKSNNAQIKNKGGSTGTSDGWIVKLLSSGDYQFSRAIGGSGNEHIYSIRQTVDSGFIVAGNTNLSSDGDVSGNHGNDDAWIAKLDDSLKVVHQICLGGTLNDYARSVIQTSDGGFIVAGYSDSNDGNVNGDNHGGYDCWVVKLDSTLGTIQWAKSYGGSQDDKANSIVQTADGGYLFAGSSNSLDGDVTGAHGNHDYWVVKLDNNGAIQREHSFGGTGEDICNSVQEVPSGFGAGYIAAGSSNSADGDAAQDQNLNHAGSNDYWITRISTYVGLTEKNMAIAAFEVYPNPVTHDASISFSLSENENIAIKVYDIAGREIKTLENKNFAKGSYNISWNVNDELENGMYLLTLETKGGVLSKKIVVIK